MSFKYSMILEAVDKASGPAKRVKQNMSALVQGTRAWGQQVKKVSRDVESGARSLQFYETRARRLRQVALGSFFRAASMSARQLSDNVRAAVRNLNIMERAGKAARAGVGSLLSRGIGMAKWGVAGAAGAAGLGLFDLFSTAGKFEQYRIAFKVAEGSADKAKAKLQWISQFATDTPYELDQVIDAFRTLQSVGGVDPTDGALRIVGDTAAGTSKDLQQVAEAYSDAVNLQFERLLDLGLRATRQGEKVTFFYKKNGQELSKTVKAQSLAVKRALDEIWGAQFGGSTSAQSRSFFGIISNLKDQWNGFLLQVADAGIFDLVKSKLQGLLDKVNEMAASGELKKWAEIISTEMEKAVNWVSSLTKADFDHFKQELSDVAKAAGAVASAIARAAEAYNSLNRYNDAISMGNTPGSRLQNMWRVYNGQKPLKYSGTPTLMEYLFGGKPDAGQKETWDRAPSIPSAVGGSRPGPTTRPATQPAKPISGRLDINITTDPGTKARVTNLSSNSRDVNFVASLGRSMGTPQ